MRSFARDKLDKRMSPHVESHQSHSFLWFYWLAIVMPSRSVAIERLYVASESVSTFSENGYPISLAPPLDEHVLKLAPTQKANVGVLDSRVRTFLKAVR